MEQPVPLASLSGRAWQPVYLVDFAVHKPPEECRVDRLLAEERGKSWSLYSTEVKDFMVKVVERSGLSQNGTYLPRPINPILVTEPKNDMKTSMEEARTVMCGAVDQLLARTGLKPSDIDILVTNCSIFCPTPSLASMLVNHFKFRSDIQSYHLGGMGCGNGVMAIGLIRDLLQARPNSIALFVPAEITTYAFYPGKHKQYMVSNCIFRMGGAAVLLSNKARYARTAKYQLHYNVRVHTGQSDESYNCMSWGPDPDGVNGVYLGKNVVDCASEALESCLQRVATRVMSWEQWVHASINWLGRWVTDLPAYRPDFTGCIDHFAIHAGGYAVLKGIQEGMELPNRAMLPSFAALRDYGNTSCSTTWYVMAYMETCEKVRKGQTIMQIGMGGGMKAGVNIWRALRNNRCIHPAWEHLANSPITEADLPRSIASIGGKRAAFQPQKPEVLLQQSAASALQGEAIKLAPAAAGGVHVEARATADEEDPDIALADGAI